MANEITLKADTGDNRHFVALNAIQCRECPDFATPLTEAQDEPYEAQDEHYNRTGHTLYWHYTVQRGESRIMDMGRVARDLKGEE